jgi:hypothetical protein
MLVTTFYFLMDEINANIVLVIPNKNIWFIFFFWMSHSALAQFNYKKIYIQCDFIVSELVNIS